MQPCDGGYGKKLPNGGCRNQAVTAMGKEGCSGDKCYMIHSDMLHEVCVFVHARACYCVVLCLVFECFFLSVFIILCYFHMLLCLRAFARALRVTQEGAFVH